MLTVALAVALAGNSGCINQFGHDCIPKVQSMYLVHKDFAPIEVLMTVTLVTAC